MQQKRKKLYKKPLRNKQKKKYNRKEKIYRKISEMNRSKKQLLLTVLKKEHICLFLMAYYNIEIKRKNNIAENEKKLYKKLLRNEQKQKIVVINYTKKGAYMLIFNGLLQLRNKKKK